MSVIELALPGYTLRDWRADDDEDMFGSINDPKIGRNMADWYPPEGYTLELARAWVQGGHTMQPQNWALCFEDRVIGAGGVHLQSGFARCNAEIGYWMAQSHWGKGVGTALVEKLTTLAFAMPGISRVFAPIHAHNLGSQRVCEKNGFVCEGLRRKSVMKAGVAIDSVVWATYVDTWKKH